VYDVPSLLSRYSSQYSTVVIGTHPFDCNWGAIVCTEVFEHLNNPSWAAIQMMTVCPLICFDYVDDQSEKRRLTFEKFRMAGTVTGPDKRGLYVWRKTPPGHRPFYSYAATAYCSFGDADN
jgi:hypothetical protein